MTHIKYDTGIIYNFGIASKFDKSGECIINFELPYFMNSPIIKVEPQDDCIVFNITLTSFMIKRKNKQLKEVKWFAGGCGC